MAIWSREWSRVATPPRACARLAGSPQEPPRAGTCPGHCSCSCSRILRHARPRARGSVSASYGTGRLALQKKKFSLFGNRSHRFEEPPTAAQRERPRVNCYIIYNGVRSAAALPAWPRFLAIHTGHRSSHRLGVLLWRRSVFATRSTLSVYSSAPIIRSIRPAPNYAQILEHNMQFRKYSTQAMPYSRRRRLSSVAGS